MLLGRLTSPSHAAIRAELVLRVQEALNALDPLDREVVALRQFEELSRAETAQVLGITEEAGAKRYIRALRRLKAVLAAMPGGLRGHPELMSHPTTRAATTCSIGSPRSSPTAFRRGRAARARRNTPTATRSWPTRSASLFPAMVKVEQVEEICHDWDDAERADARATCRRRSATTGSSARSAGAAWGSSTRPSRSRSAAAWP